VDRTIIIVLPGKIPNSSVTVINIRLFGQRVKGTFLRLRTFVLSFSVASLCEAKSSIIQIQEISNSD